LQEIVRSHAPKKQWKQWLVTSSDLEGIYHYFCTVIADRNLTWKPGMYMALAMGAISGQLPVNRAALEMDEGTQEEPGLGDTEQMKSEEHEYGYFKRRDISKGEKMQVERS
jgi:hypothetical protein